ncbi:MAG: S-layer homology domain-containing protein [Acidimicrobiia bacterium]
MGRRAAVVLLTVAMLVPAVPALAVNEYLCEGVPPAEFIDVDPTSPFAPFIDCLVAFGITSGTGPDTYSPKASVERWQMAIFLQNVWFALFLPALSGSPQGFTDVDGLSLEAQVAVNQTAQIGVTTGVAAGSYGPFGTVPRWQMAIFLARFVEAGGVGVPAPPPHEFVDLGGLSTEAQNAVSVVKSLGITTGTSATTFFPNDLVTREQMAAFLIRTLQVSWFISAADYITSCTPDAQGVDICTGSGTYDAGVPLRFVHYWFAELPADTTGYDSDGTKVDLYLDGVLQTAVERFIVLPGALIQYWDVSLPAQTGTHVIEAHYFFEGELIFVESATVTFS